jgi:hypothetical protein
MPTVSGVGRQRYLRSYFLFVLGILGIVAAAVSVVDPYGVIGFPTIRGFNAQKPLQESYTRIYRPFDFLKGRYTAVIIGGSREERGIEVSSEPFRKAGLKTYNFTFFESRPYEMAQVADWAAQIDPLRLEIFGIDFLRYNVTPESVGDYRVFYPKSHIITWALSQYAKLSISLQGLQQSYQTVAANVRGETAPRRLPTGRMVLNGDVPPAGFDYERSFGGVFDAYLNNFFPKILVQSPRWMSGGFDHGPMRRILKDAARRGVSVIVMLPPDHALEMEAVRRSGLWPAFERWKWELACVFDEMRVAYPQASLTLWDFGVYDQATTQTLPIGAAGRSSGHMDYWDPVHYALPNGERVATLLFNQEIKPDRLGGALPLTRANVAEHLSEIRRDQERYEATHRQEIEWLAAIDRTSDPSIERVPLPPLSTIAPHCAN